MARLILRGIAIAAAVLASTTASAEPISGLLGTVLFTVGATAVTVGTVLFYAATIAYSVYGSVQAKKKARAAAQRAAEMEAASLKDRTTTLLVADAPPVIVYGQPAPVGGAIVALLTSGDADQFKHVVFVLASHECTGVDEIFIAGDSVGPIDGNGYAGSPMFALDGGVPRVESMPFVLMQMSDGGEGAGSTSDGYAALPVGLDASKFALVSVVDEAGNNLGSQVQATTASPFGFGAWALKGPIGAAGTVTYSVDGPGSALNIQVHLSPGGVDTADAFLRAARPDLWTVDHRLSGYTYLVVTMNLLLERFQGGVPEITARVRGKKVHDYRTGQTVYSRNPALCLADFIRSEAGYGASAAQIELDAVVAAANACDFVVYDPSVVNVDPATFGFSTARYTCDGTFRTDQDRDRTRQQIEDAMVGFSLESGGVWRIQAGAWSTPMLSLTDDDMVMSIGIVQTCNVGTARYNGAKGTYVNATRLGVTEDFAPYVNPVFRAQDVKDKFLDITLSFTGNYIRCRQIGRVLVEQSRGGFVVQVHPKMFAWNLQPGDRIVLSSVLYAFTNKTFRVQDWTYQAGTPVALQCVEDEEAYYDQTDETRADAAPNTQLPSPFLRPAPPLDLTVQSGEANMVQQDGVMVVRARVSWQQSPDPAVRRSGIVRVQWRPVVGEAAWESADLPGDATMTYLLALAVNSMYVVRAQFQTAYASSAWSVVEHMLVGVEGPPANVMGFDVRVEAGGVVAFWREPVGIDLLGWSATQLRRGPTWALAEPATLFDGRATRADLGWFPAGLWVVWAAHRSVTERWSTPVMDQLEILAPSQPVVTGEAWRDRVELAWQECTTTQPLRGYEIRVGNIFASAPVVDVVDALGWARTESEPGKRLYWVTAVDVAGNRGAAGYKEIETLPGIDEALAELQAGLDQQLDEILAVARRGGYIRANLLYNGGFERGKDGWTTTAAAGFELGTKDWGTHALITAPPAAGRLDGKPVESITPGKTYCVSADMAFVSPTGSAVLSLEFKNAIGAVLATFRGAVLADQDFSNDPERRGALTVEGIAPAGATLALASMVWTGYSGAGKVGLRYAKVELGGLPSTVYTAETTDRYIGAAVAQVIQVANDVAARLAASYTLAVSAGKRVAGMRAMADDTKSALVFLAESIAFAIGDQDEAKQLMTLGTVNGTPSVGIAGNMYLDGVLKTRMLDAEAVTADKIRAKAITAAQIAAGAITADVINVGVGVNLVPNATLAERPGERGVPSNWSTSHNIDEGVFFGTQFGGNYQLVDGVTGFIQQVNNRYNGWGFYERNAQMHSPVFPVEPGTRYEFHARLVAHRCQATVVIVFMDYQGNWVKSDAPMPAVQPGGNALILSDYAVCGGFSTSPAGAARARIIVVKGSTSPSFQDSYLFWTQPFVAVATPHQTVFSPYTPSGLGTKITPAGITTPNLSSLSATIGWLETVAFGGRVQMRDNVIKVFDENNVLRVQLGNLDL